VIPEILGSVHRSTVHFVEVNEGGMFADVGGVEEVADGVF
jgi:hypothetical protein